MQIDDVKTFLENNEVGAKESVDFWEKADLSDKPTLEHDLSRLDEAVSKLENAIENEDITFYRTALIQAVRSIEELTWASGFSDISDELGEIEDRL